MHACLLRRRDCHLAATAVGMAQLQSVHAGGGPVRGGEQAVGIGQGAAADQRQCAIEPPVQGMQQLQQCGIGSHRPRVVGEIEQGAVDVEEDRPAGAGSGQRGRRQQVAACAVSSGSSR